MGLEEIPPTTCEVERLFSKAGNIVTNKRNRLEVITIEAIMFYKANRSLIGPEDVHKAITSPEYKGDDDDFHE